MGFRSRCVALRSLVIACGSSTGNQLITAAPQDSVIPLASQDGKSAPAISPDDYFRLRDFEYVQPLYDLAFLLEVDALARNAEAPSYRVFSLWRAGYSLDGYGTTVDRWLDGETSDEDLDYIPSSRIRQYLMKIRRSGTIPELRPFRSERFDRCLRLRSVRGLGPNRSEEHTSELQSLRHLVCRLL